MTDQNQNAEAANEKSEQGRKKKSRSKRAKKAPPSPTQANAAPAPQENVSTFPIVGIGASAGGLQAFEQFFTNMPTQSDSGMAFVLVQHLDPDHKSMLTDLVKRYTQMRVYEVKDGMEIEPNCAYIIPPNKDMALLHGKLLLMEPESPRGLRLSIDYFFRSLAEDQQSRAICIVLAGTGTDGTLGLKAIKGEGGMAMVQEPQTAAYDGMPRSAIATGLVDYILPPDKMAAQLLAYVEHAFDKLDPQGAILLPQTGESMQKIFILLRTHTGHDFSYYKQNTIHRRIERRMAINQIGHISHYVRYLQENPLEVETLFKELLIGVTNFFRDPDAFIALQEQILPQLFESRASAKLLRVWVPGCSTGEEAYSIAILLQEYLDELKQDVKVQVFATDIDAEAVETARAGLYPDSIAADVSPERLVRFFSRKDDTYLIRKSIRDMVIFAEQNVIQDPPFSKIDLISCRNLLIYFGPELQKKMITLFHYALNLDGFLFLGNSETVGEFGELFAVVDKTAKLYQPKGIVSPRTALIGFPVPPFIQNKATFVPAREQEAKIDIREVAEQALLEAYTPACAIVNQQGEVLYIHGHTGKYLEPASGRASLNILKMSREGLRIELTAALRKVIAQKKTVRHPRLLVKGNGETHALNLIVLPVQKPIAMKGLMLVIFEDIVPEAREKAPKRLNVATDKEELIGHLERELRSIEAHLQTTIEELETSNEELKSTNEELQSTNEELQSTNEELETSKEELQSVNEELVTVNSELQQKVDELRRVNNDMINLMAGTGIGTIFVDIRLNILRFTPAATQVINLIQSDVGRPINHILSNLSYDHLIQDIKAVLDNLVPKEAEVQTIEGKWYLMRVVPYRTLENVIEGVVLTFVDITEQKSLKQMLDGQARLVAVVNDSNDAITVQDLKGEILAWNPGAERMYGWSEAEALTMNIRDIVPQGKRQEVLALITKLVNHEHIKTLKTQRHTKDGRVLEIWLTASLLVNEVGQPYAVATTERDLRAS